MAPKNDGKPIEQVISEARWNMKDLQIIAEAMRPQGMVWSPDVLEEAANNIEYLLMEIERLKKYEQAVDQILKPDNDRMMRSTR